MRSEFRTSMQLLYLVANFWRPRLFEFVMRLAVRITGTPFLLLNRTACRTADRFALAGITVVPAPFHQRECRSWRWMGRGRQLTGNELRPPRSCSVASSYECQDWREDDQLIRFWVGLWSTLQLPSGFLPAQVLLRLLKESPGAAGVRTPPTRRYAMPIQQQQFHGFSIPPSLLTTDGDAGEISQSARSVGHEAPLA